MKYYIYPINQEISVFKNKDKIYLYIYNKYYYCIFKINTQINIKIINNICIEFTDYQQNNINNLHLKITTYVNQFIKLKYTKIKFSGKGYKIKKNTQQSLTLLFNRAHITIFCWKNVILKKLKKYKIYLRYSMINKDLIYTIQKIRSINIFTKKGLRQSRQILLKKKGKK